MPARYGPDLAFVHDLGYGDFAARAAPGVIALLRRSVAPGGTVVELGCGAGAATRPLVAAGYDVHAVDASAAMLQRARRHVATSPLALRSRRGRVRFVRGVLPAATLPSCDAVVAIGEVVNYMARRTAFDRLFRRVARALRPGGLFVFDVRQPGHGGRALVHGRVGRDWTVLSIATEDRARGTLVRHVTAFRRVGSRYRRTDETHRLILIATTDLVRRLRAAGFTARVAGGYGRARMPPALAVIVATRRL